MFDWSTKALTTTDKKHKHLGTCHQSSPKNSFLMHFLDDMVLDNYVHMCIYIYIYIYIWNICSSIYHKTYATHLPPCGPSPVLRGTQVEGFTSMVGFCILLGGTYKAYRPTHLSACLAMAVWKNALELGDVALTGEVEHQEVGWTTCENRWTLGIRNFFCWGINTIHESRNAHCENVNVISCWCVRSQWNCELWEPELWLTWLLRSDPPQKEGMKMARNSTNDQGTALHPGFHFSDSTLWDDLQFGPEGMDLPAVSGHRPLPCSVAVYHTSASQIECRAWAIQYRMWMMTMTTHKYECTPQIETGLWGDGINGFGRMPAWTNCKNNPNSC